MTQQEIFEYNKRCLKFIGFENPTEKFHDFLFSDDGVQIVDEVYIMIEIKKAKFHKNWNWIMEVVEAIEKLYEHPNKQICINIKGGEIEIFQMPYSLESNYYHEVIYLGDGYINNSKKQAVVEAINEFLIWYNENKTN